MKLIVLLCVLCGLAVPAHADRADQLFRKGKKLLAEKRYAEACNAFEESDKLDPGIGAKLNVAKCYQDWGKLATAWRWYRDAEAMATSTRDERARKIHALIEELDASVPRLTLKLPPDANIDGVVIKLDGLILERSDLGVERRVDPGPHQIETIINGAGQTKLIPLERGSSSEITLDVPTRTKPAAGGDLVATADPGRARRLTGMVTGGGGGLALIIAGIVTLRARDNYKYSLATHCQGATDMCDAIGLDTTQRARRRANIATVITVGGLAAVAGGLYLYVTAPRLPLGREHALYLTPQVGGDATGLVLGGAF